MQLTIVFAQLYTKGKYEGVHAFAVRIRDDNLNVMPNIRIKVCRILHKGHKVHKGQSSGFNWSIAGALRMACCLACCLASG